MVSKGWLPELPLTNRIAAQKERNMYNGQKVIDVRGHMSTPPHFRAYADDLIALRSPRGRVYRAIDQ